MPIGRILKTAVIVGIVVNVFDFLVNGLLLASFHAALANMNPDPPMALLVFGDFVAALVFVWVFSRVRSAFGPGAAGGAAFGLYAGVLVNFPTWIFLHILMTGIPYSSAWLWTVVGIAWAVTAGAATGWAWDRMGSPAPAMA